MFRSRKNEDTKNLNRVITQVGAHQVNKDILDMVVFDGENEYTIGQLFDCIIGLQNENKKLRKALKVQQNAINTNTNLMVKATQLLSAKVSALETDMAEIKEKTKYL